MRNTIWEVGTFFGVPASFFYPAFVAILSRYCTVFTAFIGYFF